LRKSIAQLIQLKNEIVAREPFRLVSAIKLSRLLIFSLPLLSIIVVADDDVQECRAEQVAYATISL
jgi:hypothetical protein